MKRIPDNAVVDPYAPPELPRQSAPGVRAPRKPSVLTAIGVLMVVLGGLYAVTWAFGLISLAAGKDVFRSNNSTANNTLDQAQANYFQALDAIQDKYALTQIITTVLQAPVLLLLIAGGIFLLRHPPRLRLLAWFACLVALLFEVGYLIPHAMIQLEHLGAANEYLNEIAGAGSQGGAAAWIARVSMGAATVVFLVLFTARVIFYGWALITLGRPEHRVWFVDEGGEVVAARIVD